MTRTEAEQQIAADLALCDMIDAFGTRTAKAAARKQRKACMAQIKAWNEEDGLSEMTIEEILAELDA